MPVPSKQPHQVLPPPPASVVVTPAEMSLIKLLFESATAMSPELLTATPTGLLKLVLPMIETAPKGVTDLMHWLSLSATMTLPVVESTAMPCGTLKPDASVVRVPEGESRRTEFE